MAIYPGDVIHGDGDNISVIPAHCAEEMANLCEVQDDLEAYLALRVQAGENSGACTRPALRPGPGTRPGSPPAGPHCRRSARHNRHGRCLRPCPQGTPMNANTHTQHPHETLIRRYFDACNAADYQALMSCFTPDAIHYFPPGLPEIPWRSADTISKKWIWCVENLGSQWTIEKVLVSHNSNEAVIEWTHWKRLFQTAQRGDEWYVFDETTGLIKEIRAYYAAPAVKDTAELPVVQGTHMGELVAFDYAGRGYNMRCK